MCSVGHPAQPTGFSVWPLRRFLGRRAGCLVSLFPLDRSLYSPSASLRVVGISQKGACAHIWWLVYVATAQRMPLDCLALVASGANIHGSHRTVANREPVLKWLSPEDTVQGQQTETPISQSSSERRVWLPISLYLGTD